jgi:hypothetical protein
LYVNGLILASNDLILLKGLKKNLLKKLKL